MADELPLVYDELSPTARRKARLSYVQMQQGRCWYCAEPLVGEPSLVVQNSPIDRDLFPSGFFNSPVHLHHDHTTGLTLGAVHARCNAYLWQYKGE